MRRVLIICLVLTAAPATALGAWTAPVTISTPHTFIFASHTAVLQSGTQVVAWSYQDGLGQGAATGARFAVRPSGGSYGPEHTLPGVFAGLGGYAQSRLLSLALAPNSDRVAVAFGSTSGMGALRTLVKGDIRYLPQLAVDPSGRAIVGWIEGASQHRRIVRVSTRAPGGQFSAPQTLVGSGRADALAVGISPAGPVVALERSGRLLARVRRTGHGWGSLQDLGPAAVTTENDIVAQVNDSGRVEVVWRHRQLTEGGGNGPSMLEAAYMPAGGGRFHSAVRIESSGASEPSMQVVSSGFVVAYSQDMASGAVARLRELTPAIGAPRDSAPAAGLTDVTPGLDTATSTYFDTFMVPQPGGDSAGQGFMQRLPAGQTPAAEAVTPSENVQQLLPVQGSRGLSAVWIARPDGTGPGVPTAQIHTVVRTADTVSAPPAP